MFGRWVQWWRDTLRSSPGPGRRVCPDESCCSRSWQWSRRCAGRSWSSRAQRRLIPTKMSDGDKTDRHPGWSTQRQTGKKWPRKKVKQLIATRKSIINVTNHTIYSLDVVQTRHEYDISYAHMHKFTCLEAFTRLSYVFIKAFVVSAGIIPIYYLTLSVCRVNLIRKIWKRYYYTLNKSRKLITCGSYGFV